MKETSKRESGSKYKKLIFRFFEGLQKAQNGGRRGKKIERRKLKTLRLK